MNTNNNMCSDEWKKNNAYYHNTADGHGGRREEHRAEMREIAEEVFKEKAQAIYNEAYINAYSDFIRALDIDVETVVNVALSNGKSIFEDKKTQKVVAENIKNELIKHINKRGLL